MKTTLFTASLVTLGSFLALPSHSQVEVLLTNPGFESEILPFPGAFTSDVLGWVESTNPGKGTFRPFEESYETPLPDGQNVAYINVGPNSLVQETVEIMQEGWAYLLRVEVGNRMDEVFAPYRVTLEADGTVLAEGSASTPAEGTFATSFAFYTVEAQMAGQALTIRLDSLQVGGVAQVNFDRVRLFRFEQGLNIFSDGFESGNALAWSTSFP